MNESLDREEREALKAFEESCLRRASDFQQKQRKHRQYASYSLKQYQYINIPVSERYLKQLQRIATQEN